MTSPARPTPAGPIRVGVAGLGAVAQAVHLPLLERHDEAFRIAAIADLSADLRTALGTRYRVPPEARHDTVAGLLDRPDLDAVVLLTSGSHGGDALAALERGLWVLCEKPLATTLAEIDRLAASPNADRLLLGYMKAWDPAVEEAARILRDEGPAFGELRSIDVHVLHPTSEAQVAFAHLRPPAGDVPPGQLRALRAAADALVAQAIGAEAAADHGPVYGGILLGSLVHELAVIRTVTGDANPLEVDHVDVWPDGAWPPSVGIAGRLSTGARVTLGWHFLDRYPAYREEVRFHAPGGSIELTFPAPYRLHLPTELRVDTGGTETLRRRTFESIEEAFERELLAFERLVRAGERPKAGIAEGRVDTVTCQQISAALAARRGIAVGGEAASAG
jgi:predicted dehydrogenase